MGLVVGGTSVSLRGQGGTLSVREGDQPVGRVSSSRAGIVSAVGDRVRWESADDTHSRLEIRPLTSSALVNVDGRPYRGSLDVYARNGQLFVINVVPLEAYLISVVSVELGPRTEQERAALRAQAILSRTYALKNRGKFRAQGYDLRASVTDQAYLGARGEHDLARVAVQNTGGQVLTYQGRLTDVFFHSTCGFATADPSESFEAVRGSDYLRSVSDRRPGGGYYCEISPRFRWKVTWEADQLREILRETLPRRTAVSPDEVDVLRSVTVSRTGPSGRAAEVRVEVSSGAIPVFGHDLRHVFRTPEGSPLGSTAVQFHDESRDGLLRELTAAGAGWGHGVGMCQWGAVGRARSGQNHFEILTTYFPGTRIDRFY